MQQESQQSAQFFCGTRYKSDIINIYICKGSLTVFGFFCCNRNIADNGNYISFMEMFVYKLGCFTGKCNIDEISVVVTVCILKLL